ncbi:hypothetical protein [Metabacillus sp. Hm71]|uniref:hypothetical protein n=1 Tax=Metabacillus sp. Hm71 TaxID=3450743 RepID=UPI003F43C037
MTNSNKKVCLKCTKEKSKTEFYQSYSEWHGDGKIPYCKTCLKEKLNEENETTIKEILRVIDRPYKKDAWQTALSNDKETLGIYLKDLALNYKYENYDNSDFHKDNNVGSTLSEFSNEEQNISQEDIDYMMKFWGRGFNLNDYIWLQNEFEDFINRYECDSKGMELLIKQICLTELDIEKRRENGEKVDQQLKTLQDLLGSSNLKPVQETGANAVEQESFGTLIKKFENEKPVPEPDEKWKDVDGIGKYIKVWFLGHLARMVGLENPYQKEYDEEVKKYKIELDGIDEEDDENGIL